MSLCFTVYTLHVFTMHKFPAVGKPWQYACSLLSVSSHIVPMDCEMEIEWQSSFALMAYVLPLQVGDAGAELVVEGLGKASFVSVIASRLSIILTEYSPKLTLSVESP